MRACQFLEVCTELDDVPNIEELVQAMRHLNFGTAGGASGIVLEMLIYGGAVVHQRLLALIKKVYGSSGQVLVEWRDAVIVPIPKKGDLRSCGNWRGISLLDVAGKLFARLIQDRLQSLAMDVLPDSQCGFRSGRGCIDMVFLARQLVEKAIEHSSDLYVLFR